MSSMPCRCVPEMLVNACAGHGLLVANARRWSTPATSAAWAITRPHLRHGRSDLGIPAPEVRHLLDLRPGRGRRRAGPGGERLMGQEGRTG